MLQMGVTARLAGGGGYGVAVVDVTAVEAAITGGYSGLSILTTLCSATERLQYAYNKIRRKQGERGDRKVRPCAQRRQKASTAGVKWQGSRSRICAREGRWPSICCARPANMEESQHPHDHLHSDTGASLLSVALWLAHAASRMGTSRPSRTGAAMIRRALPTRPDANAHSRSMRCKLQGAGSQRPITGAGGCVLGQGGGRAGACTGLWRGQKRNA